jgi:TRAP-type uncharacterized transport system substrate-binding protein
MTSNRDSIRKPVAAHVRGRVLGVIAAVALLALAIGRLDLQPDLSRVKVAILSGVEGGNYHALVDRLAAVASREQGSIENLATQGSVDNIARIVAARKTCRVQFALAQDGLDWPAGLELVARLPRSETLFVLGREADRLRTLNDLRGLRLGIGPVGSGTAMLARMILQSRDLASLGLTVVNLPFDEQLARLQDGTLDLGVLVMDEDARMIEHAVRDRGLAIMSLPFADVIARRLDRVRAGRIIAGQYDPVRVLPPTDKTVLRVDTLVIGNGCASRTATTGLLTVLSRVLPDLLDRNRTAANATNLGLAAASRSFFENGGPDFATEHLPWAVDIMPLSNWIYAITALSLLFNATSLWSRFRLWRIDARRVKAEERLGALFGANVTPAEIARLNPGYEHTQPGHRAGVAELVATFESLSTLCRQQSLSIVSDMGQEMPYRYQEHLIAQFLDALRSFRARVDKSVGEINRQAAV